MLLIVKIAYKTHNHYILRSECVMSSPIGESECDNAYNFFWMLSQSPLVAEFSVFEDNHFVMPKDFGWACNSGLRN